MKMQKEKKTYVPGEYASRLLRTVLPMKVVLLTALLFYITSVESGEFFRHHVTVAMTFDAIGRGLLFMLGGAILLDYMEKKQRG